MPVVFAIVSEEIKNNVNLDRLQRIIREEVAKGLDSKSRLLDEMHISVCVINGKREYMLADIEINVFCQRFLRRYFSRDKRANFIAKTISCVLSFDVACWINMQTVGYSRYEFLSSQSYYSVKADDKKVLERRQLNKKTDNTN